MSDGTRTRGHLDHNQVLYQLSYAHHLSGPFPRFAFPFRQEELYRIREGARARVSIGRTRAPPWIPPGPGGQSAAAWYFSAMARAVSVSGPGCGTNTASR